jgi:hypothetical protein
MKRRILIGILALILLSQIPFAYRRYRLRRLHSTIQQLDSQRSSLPASEYVDYQGVIHVHSFLGGHSNGNFADLIAGATANQLDFVIMTEHPQKDFDTSALTLNGVHAGVLFINGNEVVTSNADRLLLIPGSSEAATTSQQTTAEVVVKQKSGGGLAFVAYPTETQNWQAVPVDGVEIYNLFTNSRRINPIAMFFDGLWSYRSYPDLMFANFFERPTAALQRWDETMSATHRKLSAIAGNDAHANIGLSLNDSSGNQLLGIKLDPYERSFRTVRTHVLLKKGETLTRELLIQALAQGHAYFSFDLFSDARGFKFAVENAPEIMGDEAPSTNQTLTVTASLPGHIVLFKDGVEVGRQSGSTARFPTNGAGVYRVEAYLDSLPAPVQGQPWIISNPIYLR